MWSTRQSLRGAALVAALLIGVAPAAHAQQRQQQRPQQQQQQRPQQQQQRPQQQAQRPAQQQQQQPEQPPAEGELNASNSWAFQPAHDSFLDSAVVDNRRLNEPLAGEKGFIRVSPDGKGFVDGAGQPIRFWSVVDDGWRDIKEPAKQVEHLRFLAKLGVNMVRVHSQLCNSKEGAAITDVAPNGVEGIVNYVALARQQGIYVTISPFWSHVDKIPASWNIEGYTGKSGPEGLLFFYKPLQDAYKAWVRKLYTTPNPQTGVALKDDPGVAIDMMQNEDGVFFWTFNVQEPHATTLRQMFGDYLKKKYGSIDKAVEAWGGPAADPKDNFAAGQVALGIPWSLTTQAPKPDAAKGKRLTDQTAFMTEMQKGFYDDMAKFYKNDLGCKQLLNASNWRTADPVTLDDVERYTYTAMDVSAINRYTGGIHKGENDGYRVDPGHYLVPTSCLKNPGAFPGALKQTVGHPLILTECSWTFPEPYQTEGPFMMAAYHSMTGVNSLYWFAYGGEGTWENKPERTFWKVNNFYATKKWMGAVPQQAGMFPATSLAYRKGYVMAATEPVVHEERSLESLAERRIPVIAEEGKFDPNRDQGDFAPASTVKQEVDRLAFMVGPVEVKYGGDEKNTKIADLTKYIDKDKGIVRSVTGEIELNTKVGLCTVNAPKFQGVTGFLKDAGGSFQMGALGIKSQNAYATICAVPLDDKPLAESAKVFVQVGTVAELTGWSTKPATFESDKQQIQGLQIVNPGVGPWRLANTQASVTIKNPTLSKATVLDLNMYPAKPAQARREGEQLVVDLTPDTMYLVLE